MIKKLLLFCALAISPSLLWAEEETCRKQVTREACSAIDSCRYDINWKEVGGKIVAIEECIGIVLPECPEGKYWEPLFGCMERRGNCGEFDKTDYASCFEKYEHGGFAYCDWDSLNLRCRYRPPSPG
jgi:hypothetical protein